MATWKKILTEGNVVAADLASGADAGEILKVSDGGTAIEWGSSAGTVTSVTASGTVAGLTISSTGGSTPAISLTGALTQAAIHDVMSTIDSTTFYIGTDSDSDIRIRGNLTVTGTTTTMNTEEIQLADNHILLNSDLGSVSASEHTGLIINRGSDQNKSFYWDEDLEGSTTGGAWCVADTMGTPKARVALFSSKTSADFDNTSTISSADNFEGLGMMVWDSTGNNLYIRTDD